MQALDSIFYFCKLALAWSIHIKKNRLGSVYQVRDNEVFTVFRETVSDANYLENEVTLVVGFRLKLIKKNAFFHFLFQRVCILNTPIWVGFKGFKTKLWMVDAISKNYLGIYRYQGRENAEGYAEYITSILRPFSTKGSIWFEIIDTKFENYIKKIVK